MPRTQNVVSKSSRAIALLMLSSPVARGFPVQHLRGGFFCWPVYQYAFLAIACPGALGMALSRAVLSGPVLFVLPRDETRECAGANSLKA